MLFLLMNHFKFAGAFAWIGRFFSECIYIFDIFRFSETRRPQCGWQIENRFYNNVVPYLFRRRMLFAMTFFLFAMSSIGFRLFGAFFFGAMSLPFRPAFRAIFRLLVVNGFLTFIVRWVWCLGTSRWVACIFAGWWRGRWYWVGFAVCFSSAISIIIITDVTDGISKKEEDLLAN